LQIISINQNLIVVMPDLPTEQAGLIRHPRTTRHGFPDQVGE